MNDKLREEGHRASVESEVTGRGGGGEMSENQEADTFSVDITMPSGIFDAQNAPPFWKMLNPSMITREEYMCHQTRITCDANHLMFIACAIPLPGDAIPKHISFYCEPCDRYRHVEVAN